PVGLAEQMIPGFLAMRALGMRCFKRDITPWVIKALFAAGIYNMGKHIWQWATPLMEKHLFTSVSVTNHDALHGKVSNWVSAIVSTKSVKHFSAKTGNASAKAEIIDTNVEVSYFGGEKAKIMTADEEDGGVVRFLPVKGGCQYFWHRGRLFRYKNEVTRRNTQNIQLHEETLTISCFSRNPKHLRQFLAECWQFNGPAASKTTKVHFLEKCVRRCELSYDWTKIVLRPARSLATVDLNEKTKQSVVAEVADYLSAESPQYYAKRGIPHRRGYLLWGPPGTGKTSFCMGLASNFKLDLYVIQILGTPMDDKTLLDVFELLPKRCIVLLEDIDSAGIRRQQMRDKNVDPRAKPTLTLSGALNAIDGASSPEGRLLIMTSNAPENLDEALIRPGRIDRQVYFGHVDREVASSIFMRMFIKSAEDLRKSQDGPLVLIDNDGEDVKLRRAASLFAGSIPEDKITPAELQNFLLQHKDMKDALANVEAWATAICEAKE
ncbi:P-loop containing nucleoside triphosphate hydrolase protein, partial [Mytilinidion resinicola]